MKRFVSDDKHTELKVDSKLLKFDITKSENLKDASNIDVGFITKVTLENLKKNKKLSDKDILSFRLDCRKYLQAIVKKLLEDSCNICLDEKYVLFVTSKDAV